MAHMGAAGAPLRPPAPALVAVDGNGTLLGADGSSKALATLEKAGMQRYAGGAYEGDDARLVITENGARAIQVEGGRALYELWLDGPEYGAAIRGIRQGSQSRCFFAQLTKGGGLIEEGHPWLQCEELALEARRFFASAVADIAEELHEGVKCAKCYVTVPSSEDFDATMAELKASAGTGWEVRPIKQLLPGITKTCELQSDRVNKADGLAGLCQAIGVQMQSVWAFGDDLNDLRMLQEVGWGVRIREKERSACRNGFLEEGCAGGTWPCLTVMRPVPMASGRPRTTRGAKWPRGEASGCRTRFGRT
ncbi:unnamed protein product [Prorocentrum cordatum]|uniref:Trehalose-phosphatase n=1 Tax=Prorocentrum cordatum TaxID=2364126 RepID=A0ABN9UNS8_9DINO|nr:unnamed protein product [Polarella glacialis]